MRTIRSSLVAALALLTASAAATHAQPANPNRLSGSDYRKLKDEIRALEAERASMLPGAVGFQGVWKVTGSRTVTTPEGTQIDEVSGRLVVVLEEDGTWEIEGKVRSSARGYKWEGEGELASGVISGKLVAQASGGDATAEYGLDEAGNLTIRFTSEEKVDGRPAVRGQARGERSIEHTQEEIEARLFELYTRQRKHRYNRPDVTTYNAASGQVAARFAPTVRFDPDGVEEYVADLIDKAQESIDLSVFEFELVALSEALVRAKDRGVEIRMVYDESGIDNWEALHQLEAAGIVIKADGRSSLMHNKFMIIDHHLVWTGSTNLTPTGVYTQDNNMLVFDSPALAEVYQTEFDEMFVDGAFGPTSPANTRWSNWKDRRAEGEDPTEDWLDIDGVTSVQVYFAPEDAAMDRLIEIVKGAKSSIKFMAFAFTSEPLFQAMVERIDDGVEVSGIFESHHAGWNTIKIGPLHNAGALVRFDANPWPIHHKVIIVDDQIVCTGSFNFSAAADRSNDENLVVVRSPGVASAFVREFEAIISITDPDDPRIATSGMADRDEAVAGMADRIDDED